MGKFYRRFRGFINNREALVARAIRQRRRFKHDLDYLTNSVERKSVISMLDSIVARDGYTRPRDRYKNREVSLERRQYLEKGPSLCESPHNE